MMPHEAVAHLTPAHWRTATRHLVRKALAEFAHERLVTPELVGPDRYRVAGDGAEYLFAATLRALNHWDVDVDSVTRRRDGVETPLDALELVLDLRTTLGLSEEMLPGYLTEIAATVAAGAFRAARRSPRAAKLAKADFQVIEGAMTEGHPGFVANSGRLGFGVDDQHRHAPEAAQPAHLVWLAAHRDHTVFTCSRDLDYDTLISQELGTDELEGFDRQLTSLGLDPVDYMLFPVHPWQWWNTIATTFAAELAARRLVCLGEGTDDYLPQQSLRTWFNISTPARHYVKTALSVVNMGFTRGLSAAYMAGTPAINDWVADIVAGDDLLRSTGVTILRERAAVGYHPRQFERATDRASPYRKMLAALWRESPVPGLAPGQRLTTMAALLHVDDAGRSVVASLIEESGRSAAAWVRRYLDAYLTPLLHCFYGYELVFMPHGENVILVLSDGLVDRVLLKDIAEEVVVTDPDVELPEEVRRIQLVIPEDIKLLSIFSDVFDGFFRHLSAVLARENVLAESAFWELVGECSADYVRKVPHLDVRLRRYDLFADEFTLSCLNRLQLRNHRQMLDLTDPAGALQFAGTMPNPIAAYRPTPGPVGG